MSLIVYHGTNGRFSQFEQSKARIQNDFYGGGVAYFTSSLEVAKTYAASMARRLGGDKFIYEVRLDLRKIFDVDEMYDGKDLMSMIGTNVEQFARSAGLLKLGDDRTSVLSKLKTGKMAIRGDQVFKGMSNGMISTKDAREKLIRLGFDGLRYNGGLNMNMNRHDVYLAYYASSVTIINRYIVSPTPVPASSKQEVYSFIN